MKQPPALHQCLRHITGFLVKVAQGIFLRIIERSSDIAATLGGQVRQDLAQLFRLAVMGQQAVGPGGHGFGQCQQPQRVTGGGGIEDHQVIGSFIVGHDTREALQQRRLLRPGRLARQAHLAFQLLHHLGSGIAPHLRDDTRQVRFDFRVGVDLHGIEIGQQAARRIPQLAIKHIAQAVCRIGGNHQHPALAACRQYRQRSRDGGFAYATLAADPEQAFIE